MRRSGIDKAPTVYDVALAAGVSIATVSFTFRQPARVKKSTRDSVVAAAHSLGYVPSASARGLAAGRTGAIGLVSWDVLAPGADSTSTHPSLEGWPLSDESNDSLELFPRYVDEVQHGIETAAWRNGLALMVGGGNHENSDATIIDIAGRVDGLVILPHTLKASTIARIAERIPVVIVSETEGNDELSKVTVDNTGGVDQLLQHLTSVHGVRRVEFVGATDSVEYEARFTALCAGLAACGLPVPDAPLDAFEGMDALVDRFRAGSLPDALVCRNDSHALELMKCLQKRGIEIPRDVIITGFDGIAAGLISVPRLTTVRQPMEAMGVAAVELLIEQFETPDQAPKSRHFPVALVIRESCGC